MIVAAVAGSAHADDADELAPAPKDHHKQFGVGLQIAIGARAIKPYEDTDFCGERLS